MILGGIFNHINSNLYHYAGNNPVRYVDPDGREDECIIKEYIPDEPQRTVYSAAGSLLPSVNYTQKIQNQNKEQKAVWGEATFVDGAGENSCLLEIGVYSLSSELNKDSSPIYASASLDVLGLSFNSTVTDGGASFGFSANAASVTGKIGLQFSLFGYDIQANVGGSAGLTAGVEGKFDISSG
ncbi:MAG: hypothetical protein IKZ04_02545, partial [Spirochaetaceae bacterium]|nr:hypothetical protein [Spirochaetaceae bacterium]